MSEWLQTQTKPVYPRLEIELSAEKIAGTVAKWLTEAARLGAIMFFLYCAYEGVFVGGGSTMVFVGVSALVFTLVICHFLEQIPKAASQQNGDS
jgi:hypothetical protein